MHRAAVAIGLTFATLVVTPTYAAEKRDAQAVIAEAEKAFMAKDYETALRLYTRARELKDAPLLIYMTGRCYEELGRLQEAVDRYKEYLAVGKEPGPLGRATAAVRLLGERLATGTLVLHVSPFGADVFVAGKHVGKAPLQPQRLKPGSYVVKVVKADRSAESRVVVRGDATVTHVVDLDAEARTVSSGSGLNVGAVALMGGGGAVALAGIITAAVGQADLSSVSDAAGTSPTSPSNLTQREARDRIDAGVTTRTAGIAVTSLGVLAAIGGAVWYALDAGPPASTKSTSIESAGVTPLRGGGAAFSLRGGF